MTSNAAHIKIKAHFRRTKFKKVTGWVWSIPLNVRAFWSVANLLNVWQTASSHFVYVFLFLTGVAKHTCSRQIGDASNCCVILFIKACVEVFKTGNILFKKGKPNLRSVLISNL